VWRVAGEDLPAGVKVRVVAVEDGAEVRVEKA
jgi:membrane protein implicated in regulation of membrane protease activity